MSNKVVPAVYRVIIDDVIASVQQDFEEYGLEEELLKALQQKWEAKLLETRVADFDGTGGQAGPSNPMAQAYNPSAHYGQAYPPVQNYQAQAPKPEFLSQVKAEPGYPADDPLRLRGGAPSDVKPNDKGLLPGDEVIDSDLDDSDDDAGDGEDGDDDDGPMDIVFCVYDKVQRVKNKWKTVFKDGMVHINGKDYLFAKCNGEFEW